MKIAQVMKQGLQSCRVEDRLNRAVQIMWEHDCATGVPLGATEVSDGSVFTSQRARRPPCHGAS